MQNIEIHNEFTLNGKKFDTSNALIHYVENNLSEHAQFVKEIFNKQDFIIAHTSGSTGTPKEITILKEHLINSAQNTINYFNLAPQTTALLNLSSDFIAGKMMWIRAIIGGWHLDVISPENKAIAKQLQTKKYDFGAMVTLQAYQNIAYLNNISKLIIGGGNVPNELLQKIQKLTNQCFATYGMTETVTHIAVKQLNGIKKNDFYTILDAISISTDDRNCLVIDAPKLASEQIITNDIIKKIDQRHFVWLGRYDNIINSGGVKIIPEQVEKKISSVISARFFIGSLPDEKLGEKVVLIIEGAKDNLNLPNFETILSKYEVPKKIYFFEKFMETATGKILRKKMILFQLK